MASACHIVIGCFYRPFAGYYNLAIYGTSTDSVAQALVSGVGWECRSKISDNELGANRWLDAANFAGAELGFKWVDGQVRQRQKCRYPTRPAEPR